MQLVLGCLTASWAFMAMASKIIPPCVHAIGVGLTGFITEGRSPQGNTQSGNDYAYSLALAAQEDVDNKIDIVVPNLLLQALDMVSGWRDVG